MSHYDIIITNDAENDLENIQQHSLEVFGLSQTQKYEQEIFDTIFELTANPKIGHSRDDVPAEYRVLNIKRHAVIYKIVQKEVIILRVLHGSMNFSKIF